VYHHAWPEIAFFAVKVDKRKSVSTRHFQGDVKVSHSYYRRKMEPTMDLLSQEVYTWQVLALGFQPTGKDSGLDLYRTQKVQACASVVNII
jgi:hypothetical protein